MKITRISQQIKNPDRVNVFVDGKYSFSFSLNQVLETKIKVSLEIGEDDLKKFQKLSADGKLKMRTLEWLTLRPHSRKELIDYLKRKKLEPEQIETWLKNFQKMGYQNEQTFTSWWVEQRLNKQKSKRYIRQELRSKGVSQELIEEALVGQVDEKKVLRQLITKKRRIIKYQDDTKLTEYLIRQGFNYSLVKELLAEE